MSNSNVIYDENGDIIDEHKHKPRIIDRTNLTYQKGTIICSKCGLKLKDPKQQILYECQVNQYFFIVWFCQKTIDSFKI